VYAIMAAMKAVQDTVGRAWEWLTGPYGPDPRVAGWPLLDPVSPWAISLLYLVGIAAGTRLMRRREAFTLRTFSLVHNALLLGLSLFMATECVLAAGAHFGWWGPNARPGARYLCVDPATAERVMTPTARRLARVLYIHYLSKAYEFVDTFIMVFKKKHKQISFLHVYHHATTFAPVWYHVVKYHAGGEAWVCCALNSAIHVLMYSYYLLSALYPASTKQQGFGGLVQAYLRRVKPLMTYSQMGQFLILMAQGAYLLTTDYVPKIQPFYLLVQCAIFFGLFANFALQEYGGSRRKKRADEKSQ
jgi:hypothetical protein